jgi:DNA repair protein RadD
MLREYQEDALTYLDHYYENEQGKNALIIMPTGSGKSLVIAEFCRRVIESNPTVRILVVTHVKELIAQNESELKGYWPEAKTGIYSAGLGKRNTTAQILFVGIQSIYNKAFSLNKTDIIVCDECHLIPRDSQTRYGRFLADMLKANPNTVVVGLTATPYRMDSGLLHEGDDALFDGIAYCCEMKRLIAEGWLVPVISKGGVAKINLEHVHLLAGEYKADELARAADDPELIRRAVAEMVTYGHDRKAWLVFAAGVAHAEHVAKEIEVHGIKCAIITGDTPAGERDSVIKAYRDGKIRCIVNVGVLTTGFNAPVCDLIALLMATRSTGKYVQIVGRGMRTYPGKENCLLLDYGNNVITHGAIDEVDPIKTKNVFNVEKKAPPMKECPQCHVILYAREMLCPACGYEFPSVAPHGTSAYDGEVMSAKKEAFFVDVAETYYERSKRAGRPDILKIGMYDKMDKEFPLWCCLEHDGYAKEKANQLVKQFGGTATNVTDALKESDYWRRPKRIKVIANGNKFFNVLGIEFLPAQPKQQQLSLFDALPALLQGDDHE